jgi:hypothetical protein
MGLFINWGGPSPAAMFVLHPVQINQIINEPAHKT